MNPYAHQSSQHQIPRRKSKHTEKKYNEHIKIYTDGSKKDEKVGCAVLASHQEFKKRLKPQYTVYRLYTVLNKKQSSKRYTSKNGQVNGE
jgi:hypothetical protein